MWKLIIAVLVLLLPLATGADTVNIPSSGSGSGNAVPGLVNGYGNEETVGYLSNLGSFEALPNYPRYYFSADATGDYPLGDDTLNPGTPTRPFRTLSKAAEIGNAGHVILVFDASDTWETGVTDSGAGVGNYTLTKVCPSTEELCVAWIGSDPSGSRKATFDCQGMFGADVFRLFQNAGSGWWAFANLNLDNCPRNNVGGQDIFRDDSIAQTITLNVRVPNLRGGSNQYYTSHNAGGTASQFVAINPYCEMTDSALNSPQCIRSAGNTNQIIINGQFVNSFDPPAGENIIVVQAAPVNFTMIGGHIAQEATLTAGRQANAILLGTTGTSSAWISHVGINGFVNGTTASGAFINAGLGGDTSSYTLYKVAVSNSGYFFYGGIPGQAGVSVVDVTIDCALMDGITRSLMVLPVNGAPANCDFVTLRANNLVFDEAGAAAPYIIEGVAPAPATKDFFEALSTSQGCAGAPWEWNGVATATDQFPIDPDAPICQHATCFNACTTPKSHTFFANGYIPAFVVGEAIQGFNFEGSGNVGP